MVSLGFWICARGEINRRFESPPGTRRDQGRASPFYAPSLLPAGGRAARIRARQMQKRRYPNGYLRFWSCWADSNPLRGLGAIKVGLRPFYAPSLLPAGGRAARIRARQMQKRRYPNGYLRFWSCWADSNCRPHPYQGCALPTELQQRKDMPLFQGACGDQEGT